MLSHVEAILHPIGCTGHVNAPFNALPLRSFAVSSKFVAELVQGHDLELAPASHNPRTSGTGPSCHEKTGEVRIQMQEWQGRYS